MDNPPPREDRPDNTFRANPSSGPRLVVAKSQPQAVLNYFGRCPACGYLAEATTTTFMFRDGSTERMVIAECAMPCGWSDAVDLTTMTITPSRHSNELEC